MMRKPSHDTPPTSGGNVMSSSIKSGFSLRTAATRLRAVQRGDDLITGALQLQGNRLEDDFIVINDQNFFLAGWSGFGAHKYSRLQQQFTTSNSQLYANLANASAGAKQFYAL